MKQTIALRIALMLMASSLFPAVSQATLFEPFTVEEACRNQDLYLVFIGKFVGSTQLNPMGIVDANGQVLAVVGRTAFHFIDVATGEKRVAITLWDANAAVAGYPKGSDVNVENHYRVVVHKPSGEFKNGDFGLKPAKQASAHPCASVLENDATEDRVDGERAEERR